MGTTPVGFVSPAGFVRQDFPYTLNYWQTNIRAIYGQDTYLGADSQDGQLATLEAQGVYDTSGVALAVYNAFSPATAIGTGLDRVVKINGIARKRASYSTAPLRIIGTANLVVTNGSVTDPAGYVWSFPQSVQIPASGESTVTITCQTLGAILLVAGGIDTAAGQGAFTTETIQQGLQAAVTVADASIGQPVESDSALRQRQAVSVALPSQTILGGLVGALYAISGVTRLRAYENDTNQPDANGIPGKGISIVIEGGDATTIANVINLKKGAAGTYGSTVVPVTDDVGITRNISFFRPTIIPISYAMQIRPLAGYTQAVEAQIQQALADWTSGLGIGNGVLLSRAYAPADLSDQPTGATFEIIPNSLTAARDGRAPTAADVGLAFNEAPVCVPSSVTITYVS